MLWLWPSRERAEIKNDFSTFWTLKHYFSTFWTLKTWIFHILDPKRWIFHFFVPDRAFGSNLGRSETQTATRLDPKSDGNIYSPFFIINVDVFR